MKREVLDAIETVPETAGTTTTFAGLVSRLTALAVDATLLTVACLSISVLPGLAWDEVIGRSPGWLGAVSGTVSTVLPWLYFTCCWRLSGQTAGNLLVGISVQRADGRRISLLQAALRAAIGLALAPLWLVGMLGILWNPQRRAWHDVLLRTVVRHTLRDRRTPSAATTRVAADG